MDYKISVGDAIPQFTAKDQEGFEITTEDLYGSPILLYFYPKDGTPGCTAQACAYRDSKVRLDAHDIIVMGVSSDGKDSHQKFMQNYQLDFTLLTDENFTISKKFDVYREKKTGKEQKPEIERTAFLIDRDGIIQWLERPVIQEGHVERVLEAIKKHNAL